MKLTELGVASRLTAVIRLKVMVQQKEFRGFPGSIATKIGSESPPIVCNNTTTPPGEPVTVSVMGTGRPQVCFKVVPVKICSRNGAKEIVTYALSDSGSDASFYLESLLWELYLKDMKPIATSFTMSAVNWLESWLESSCYAKAYGYQPRSKEVALLWWHQCTRNRRYRSNNPDTQLSSRTYRLAARQEGRRMWSTLRLQDPFWVDRL